MLILLWLFIAIMAIRLLARKGAYSLSWWLATHSFIVLVIVGTVYIPTLGHLSRAVLDWGANSGWTDSVVLLFVYLVRLLAVLAVLFTVFVLLRKRNSALKPTATKKRWLIPFYLLLLSLTVIDCTALDGAMGWVVGLEWILPLGQSVNRAIVFCANSLIVNYPMGALIVLSFYWLKRPADERSNISKASSAICWQFSFPRFVCLLFSLAVLVPANVFLGIRLLVHLVAMENNLTVVR